MTGEQQQATGLAPQSLVQLGGTSRPSSFDTLRAPEASLLDACVHCGFCLPACPTYELWGEEMDSPRGRIWMMKKAAAGEAALGQDFRVAMDNCLGCMACVTACPSGVEYSKLIEDTRGQVERNIPRPLGDSLYRKMLFTMFPHPRRLRALGVALSFYQRSGLQRVLRASGLLRLLPARFRAMEDLLPPVPLNPFHRLPVRVPAKGAPRGRVGVLTGCVQDAYFAHVNAATVRVLAAEGFEVIVPRGQGCCGALHMHTGQSAGATRYAKAMITQFEEAGVEAVIVNAAGCGSTMKEYAHLLRDDPRWAGRAERFSKRCRDISEFLADHAPRAPRAPLSIRVAYHDACHLRHAQGIFTEPRALLRGVPGMDVVDVAEETLCCGSAGVYNLLHPATAQELGDRKAEHLIATQADAVVSANPGCLLQLMSALRRKGHAEVPAFHMVELLDASISGLTRNETLHGRRRMDVSEVRRRCDGCQS